MTDVERGAVGQRLEDQVSSAGALLPVHRGVWSLICAIGGEDSIARWMCRDCDKEGMLFVVAKVSRVTTLALVISHHVGSFAKLASVQSMLSHGEDFEVCLGQKIQFFDDVL
jgi:hypothetical protein